MTAPVWILLAIYLIGVAYYHAKDHAAWRRQGIPYPWGRLTLRQVAWPIIKLRTTLEWLRR